MTPKTVEKIKTHLKNDQRTLLGQKEKGGGRDLKITSSSDPQSARRE